MAPLDAQTTLGGATSYPDVPEPMVFDMVRPLGARRGELEINTLVQRNGSGPHAKAEWAPEVEYAVADGFAVELELPVEGLGIAAYKMGLQGTFGTFAGGRGVHGVQYLGLYDRTDRQWRSTLLYLVGFRLDDRWSTMSMIGAGDVALSGRDRSRLIVNHSTFYDLSHTTLAGVEVNMRLGGSRYTMLMPQVHHRLPKGFSIQGGVGAVRDDGEPWRPRAGVRVIKQF
ncbi:hypothetical protein E5673_02070 [Sphingomonas sp. PAMC26645]|nr:hypothetical protein E5673_02070 [Sphingomonas sp. PAMC26645]